MYCMYIYKELYMFVVSLYLIIIRYLNRLTNWFFTVESNYDIYFMKWTKLIQKQSIGIDNKLNFKSRLKVDKNWVSISVISFMFKL